MNYERPNVLQATHIQELEDSVICATMRKDQADHAQIIAPIMTGPKKILNYFWWNENTVISLYQTKHIWNINLSHKQRRSQGYPT